MSDNRGYHAHVYYNAETKPAAAKLRETLIEKFKVEGGALSDEPRGPHPISQFAVIFETCSSGSSETSHRRCATSSSAR